MKAWRTCLHDVESVVFAPTRGKAIAITVRAAADAWGRENAKWVDVRAIRYPGYDDLDEKVKLNSCGPMNSV